MPRGSFLLTLTTAGSLREARRIAKAAVGSRACACVNIVPNIHSIYRWKGRVEESGEFLLLLKTHRRRLAALYRVIRKNHSYELPEILTLTISQGEKSYLKWIEASLTH